MMYGGVSRGRVLGFWFWGQSYDRVRVRANDRVRHCVRVRANDRVRDCVSEPDN